MARLAKRKLMWACGDTAANEIIWVTTRARDHARGIRASGERLIWILVSEVRQGAAMRAPLALAFGLLLGLVLSSGVAHAHGDAEWIRNMQLGCCGPTDCASVPDGTWVRQENGYFHLLTGEFIPHAAAKASVDEHFWECRYSNGKVRSVISSDGGMCLFVPSIGF